MPSTLVPAAALDRLFRPRSVALYGVSADPHKLNGAPLPILRRAGFPGAIYPVNPKYETIDGLACHARYADLPEAPDVALVMLPAREVPGALAECGRKGTRAAVVISSGFEETGDGGLVRAVRDVCREQGIALVGPNCEGVWSVRAKALLTFGSAARRDVLAHRPVAILSQSGAMAGAVARHLQDSGFGCAYVVSVGNETVLGLLDYLEWMLAQDDVRVVLLFMEGLKNGARLLALAERARSRGIVLVALKSGNSAVGREAAASHTGKIASAADVYRDVFAQAGIIVVEGLVELVEAAEVLSSLPPPRTSSAPQPGVAVYSIPGGTRALTADQCETRGVPLARFGEATVRALEAELPAFGSAQNPTDITGKILSAPDLFHRTLGLVANDPATEALIVQLANRGPQDAVRYRATMEMAAAAGLPVFVTFLGDALPGPQRCDFAASGLACARDPGDAVRYLSWLYAMREFRGRPAREARAARAGAPLAGTGWRAMMDVLADCGVAVPKWTLLAPGTAPDLASLAFPLAVKALPEDAPHKTERGLLRLDLRDAAAVDAACIAIRAALGSDGATLIAQEMVAGGVECVVALRRDPDFGAVLSLGSGGVAVELVRDLGHLALPCGARDVRRLIDRLRLARRLAGFRGAPAADTDALVAAVLALADRFPSLDIDELEINPLIVLPAGQGVRAVDALATPRAAAGAAG